jgi:hypothetical protein
VHSKFPQQTPQLQGAGNRSVFGSEAVPEVRTVSIMEVAAAGDRVLLKTGQVQAVTKGAQFAVYAEQADLTQVDERLALVEIDDLGASSSWARVIKDFERGDIKDAAQAVLLDPGKVRLRRRVRLYRQATDEVPETVDQDAAFAQVEAALQTDGAGWVRLGEEGETVDYQVAVNKAGEYEIWDRAGEPIPNLRPALKIDAPGAAKGVAQRLVHLTKYNNLLLLDNFDSSSPLARALDVEVMKAPPDFEPGEPPIPDAFDDPGHTPEIDVGDWVLVRVRNAADQVLNVAVLDMSSDWGIVQVHPNPKWADYISLDPDAQEIFPLRAGLPAGYEEGTDVLKVFATLGSANFRWLELPELDKPPTRKAIITRSLDEGDPLEAILAAFTDDRLQTGKRSLDPAEYPSRGWATTQVEVHIKKASAG